MLGYTGRRSANAPPASVIGRQATVVIRGASFWGFFCQHVSWASECATQLGDGCSEASSMKLTLSDTVHNNKRRPANWLQLGKSCGNGTHGSATTPPAWIDVGAGRVIMRGLRFAGGNDVDGTRNDTAVM